MARPQLWQMALVEGLAAPQFGQTDAPLGDPILDVVAGF
jgi:hypothetical protein